MLLTKRHSSVSAVLVEYFFDHGLTLLDPNSEINVNALSTTIKQLLERVDMKRLHFVEMLCRKANEVLKIGPPILLSELVPDFGYDLEFLKECQQRGLSHLTAKSCLAEERFSLSHFSPQCLAYLISEDPDLKNSPAKISEIVAAGKSNDFNRHTELVEVMVFKGLLRVEDYVPEMIFRRRFHFLERHFSTNAIQREMVFPRLFDFFRRTRMATVFLDWPASRGIAPTLDELMELLKSETQDVISIFLQRGVGRLGNGNDIALMGALIRFPQCLEVAIRNGYSAPSNFASKPFQDTLNGNSYVPALTVFFRNGYIIPLEELEEGLRRCPQKKPSLWIALTELPYPSCKVGNGFMFSESDIFFSFEIDGLIHKLLKLIHPLLSAKHHCTISHSPLSTSVPSILPFSHSRRPE